MQFQLYVGLTQHAVPVSTKKKKSQFVPATAPEPDSEGSDDEEDEEDFNVTDVSISAADIEEVDKSSGNSNGTGRKKPKAYKALGSAYDKDKYGEKLKGLTLQQKLELRKEEKDTKMNAFFDDPEKNIKIFFSSYFRDRGLLWCVIHSVKASSLYSRISSDLH